MDKDLLNQSEVKSLSSIENGFQKEEKRYGQETWEYVQYREGLVRRPLLNEKIKMGLSHNNG